MDPDANIEEQLRLAASIQEDFYGGNGINEHDTNRLAELVLVLNQWIVAGGFLPRSWRER